MKINILNDSWETKQINLECGTFYKEIYLISSVSQISTIQLSLGLKKRATLDSKNSDTC